MRGFAIVAAAALVTGCGIGAEVPVAKTEAAKFHREFNAGKFALIYRGASKDLTDLISEADWIKMCELIQARLGKFKEGNATGWNDQWNNGIHQIDLVYDSTYERAKAQEDFVYRKVGDRFLLAGFHVKSPALMDPPAAQ
jgi:hypothetical protein